MIGAQNQARRSRSAPRAFTPQHSRQRVLDRRGHGARRGGDFGEQPQDAPSRVRDAVGPDIERQRIPGAAHAPARPEPAPRRADRDPLRRAGAASRNGGGRERLVESSNPDQRGDLRERSRPRQRDGVVAAIVEPLTVDEGDRRFQDRHAPLQRARRCLVRVAALLGPPPQALHVVARVPAARGSSRRSAASGRSHD